MQVMFDDDELHYSAEGLPDGLSINSATGEVGGIPSSDTMGSYNIKVTVNDGIELVNMEFALVVAAFDTLAPEVTVLANQLIDATGLITDVDLGVRSALDLVDGSVAVFLDQDADGEPDAVDNCPGTVNADQLDTDADGEGDACTTPRLTGVSLVPNASTGETNVKLFGENLQGATSITINGMPYDFITVTDGPFYTLVLPVGIVAEQVVITTERGRAINVELLAGALDGLSITGYLDDGGSQIDLYGNQLDQAIEVWFNGVAGTNLLTNPANPYHLVVTPPAGVTAGPIMVVTATGSITSLGHYLPKGMIKRDQDGDDVRDSVDNCPSTFNADQLDADADGRGDVCKIAQITSVYYLSSSMESPDTETSIFQLLGENLDNVSEVMIGGIPAEYEQSVSGVVSVYPTVGAVQDYVVVTTPQGRTGIMVDTEAASASASPRITGYWDSAWNVSDERSFKITGSADLSDAVEVTVNGTGIVSSEFIDVGAGYIQFTLPAGTGSGSITVTLKDGNVLSSPIGYEAPDYWKIVSPDRLTGSFGLGAHSLIWSAVDEAGNVGSTTQTVTIQDMTAPVITAVAPDILREATGALTPVEELGTTSANDSVDGVLTATPDQTGLFSVGSHNIIWTAADVAGNSVTATQIVTIQDTTDPVITAVAPDILREATGALTPVKNWESPVPMTALMESLRQHRIKPVPLVSVPITLSGLPLMLRAIVLRQPR